MKLIRANVNDCEKIWKMQTEAFSDLLEKYQDYETSPGNEAKERIEAKLSQEFTYFYYIFDGDNLVGAIRVVDKKDGSRKRVAPVFIMKEFRNKGLAQKAFEEVEKIHGHDNWKLDTILQEEGNCYLYEKLGYKRTGLVENINDKIIAVIILGDDKENAFRRNFSAAHELGHLLLDDFYDIEGMSKVEYKEMEDTMNRFAGALLVPEEVYRTDLQTNAKTEINFYIQMKKKYGVSAAALIVRARQLEEITTNQYQYLMKQLSQKGYRTCEPYDKETKQMQPRYLKEAMKMIIEEDKITGTEFLEVVSENGTSISEEIVENILNLDEGYLRMNDSSGEVVALERR